MQFPLKKLLIALIIVSYNLFFNKLNILLIWNFMINIQIMYFLEKMLTPMLLHFSYIVVSLFFFFFLKLSTELRFITGILKRL